MLDIIKINKYVLQKTPRKWEDRNIEDICKAYTWQETYIWNILDKIDQSKNEQKRNGIVAQDDV